MFNIYQRINAVRNSVKYLQKDKEVSTGGRGSYKAITHDKVTNVLHDHLVDHGIIILPSLVESRMLETGSQTSNGTHVMRLEATFNISFINVDNPDDLFTILVEAHANDTGDKAPGKALSYATKMAMLKVFTLETGEDDEEVIETTPSKLTEDQALNMLAKAEEFNEGEKLLNRMAEKLFKVKSYTDIPSEAYERAMNRLIKHLQDNQNATG